MRQQRIPLVDPPYTADQEKSFNMVMPPGMPPLKIFRTLAHNPRVLRRLVSAGLLDKGAISIEDRELVILRTCAICEAGYEWGVHVALFTDKTRFTQAQLMDTCQTRVNPDLWSDQQICLIEMVDSLQSSNKIPALLWSKLIKLFDEAQLIELVTLCGLYHTVSFLVNSFDIEQEEFAPDFVKRRT